MTQAEFTNLSLNSNISSTAIVAIDSSIAKSAKIWNYTQIRENVTIGESTIIGSFVYIDSNVRIGRNCKIQNRAMVYDPAEIQNGVFIGPGAILTNDHNPRAVKVNGEIKLEGDWAKEGVVIEKGASIGAGAICIAPVRIGAWAFVGAGAVVTKSVPAFAIVVGCPAKQIGWVGRHGIRLIKVSEDMYVCPKTKAKYKFLNGSLEELDYK